MTTLKPPMQPCRVLFRAIDTWIPGLCQRVEGGHAVKLLRDVMTDAEIEYLQSVFVTTQPIRVVDIFIPDEMTEAQRGTFEILHPAMSPFIAALRRVLAWPSPIEAPLCITQQAIRQFIEEYQGEPIGSRVRVTTHDFATPEDSYVYELESPRWAISGVRVEVVAEMPYKAMREVGFTIVAVTHDDQFVHLGNGGAA